MDLNELILVSVDDHTVEPPDMFDGRVSTKYRDQAPRIVQATGGRVVDGPTASNAYVLQVPVGQREQILARLRAEPSVVLAQPLTVRPDR